jgi:hypothetical protein
MISRRPSERNPFARVLLPVFSELKIEAALDLVRAIGQEVTLMGILPLNPGEQVSAAAGKASQFRSELLKQYSPKLTKMHLSIRVTHDPFRELQAFIEKNPHDLLVLEWPTHFNAFRILPVRLFESDLCDLALVRGAIPENIERIFLPVRGGPYAEMALRLSRLLPHQELYAVNYASSPGPAPVEAPFRGLSRILPNLPDVTYVRSPSSDPVESILSEARKASLLVMGISVPPKGAVGSPVSLWEEIMQFSPCPVVAVKTCETPPVWSGSQGALAGAQAISLLVDHWFAENTYHAREFDDLEMLVKLKEKEGVTISLALPALNEEQTVGKVISTVKTALMDDIPLLDEMVLIDSMSSDRTREIAADMGVPVYVHQELLPAYGARRGKGEALWKSLYVTSGDILVWIDTDIVNIHPRFVYGVIGPLLVNPAVQFVKGFYRRPLRVGDKVQAGGGGRVTELVARPLLNLFYPELSGVVQPLSGEYGGRRSALERLNFFSGYGVEIGLLIGIYEEFGLPAIAQVDLLERVHHNQPLEALSKMSFTILQAFMSKLERRAHVELLEDVNRSMKLLRRQHGSYFLDVEELPEFDRPPLIDLPEYRQKHPELEEE